MGTSTGSNQGEGNRQAAENFNDAERDFVNSADGKAKIKKGPEVQPGEEADLEAAEETARKHGKDDPADRM
ncbi:MAG TPA: hypothetical protein VHV81_03740 [Steroidobacteraceae bacterium]|jgi:hypothetical protein|nr:hypothetical protein [Steroidobacteraceae bacterium]